MSPRKVIERPRFFWVICDDWALGPYDDRAHAERILAGVLRLGACSLPHEIVETQVAGRRPRTKFTRY